VVAIVITNRQIAWIRVTVVRSSEPGVVDRPRREVAAIVRHLMHVTEQARMRAPDAGGRLFVAASVTQGFELRLAPWAPNKERSGFVDWLAAAGVAVGGAADIRRLRKSTKVEKAIAFLKNASAYFAASQPK
jgi:hypothetical protein